MPPAETLAEEKANMDAQENYRQTLIAAGQAVIAPQTESEAIAAFYNVLPPKPEKAVQKMGEPIPGYSGINRRI